MSKQQKQKKLIKSKKALTKQNLEKALKDHFNDDNLTLEGLESEDLILQNEGFMSCLANLDVKIKRNGENEELGLLAKFDVDNSFMKFLTKVIKPQLNEAIFYTKLIPELLENGCENESERQYLLQSVPKCFYSYTSYSIEDGEYVQTKWQKKCCWLCYFPCLKTDSGLLILEDLKKRPNTKIALYDKTKLVDFQTAKLCFESIAQFHGLFWRWLHKQKIGELKPKENINAQLLEELRENQFTHMKSWLSYSEKNNAKFVQQFLELRNESEEMIKYIQNVYKKSLEILMKELSGEAESKFKTLLHSDFRISNMMFDFEENQAAKSVILIDFQVIVPGNPVKDLCYFVGGQTDAEFRKRNLDDLLHIYYNKIDTFMRPYVATTFEEFKAEFDEFYPFAVMQGNELIKIALNPDPFPKFSLKKAKQQMEELFVKFTSLDKEDDHPDLIEAKRRIYGNMKEAFENKIIG